MLTITPDFIPDCYKKFKEIKLIGFVGKVKLDLTECETLDCFNNLIKSLPDLPICKTLICNKNMIERLPELPNCETLWCENNPLGQLPKLPKCKTLRCNSGTQLTKLPELPQCKYLFVCNNRLKRLPELPECVWLECKKNQIEKLPRLPKIKELDASGNKIKRIEFPMKGHLIDLGYNQIFEYPDIECNVLIINDNDINFIPDIKVAIELDIRNNPLKNYNVYQLREKKKCKTIYYKSVQNETYKFTFTTDIVFK